VPAELDGHPLRQQYVDVLDHAFETYARWIDPMREWFEKRHPRTEGDSDAVYRSAIRAKALDTLRGLLPAATQSNVGIYGTGQAYESLLLRMRAHPLAEVRQTADAMLEELRKVIPAFLTRVDQPERGGRWTTYLADARQRTAEVAERLTAEAGQPATSPREVTLVDFDPEGETKVVAAALYATSSVPDAELLTLARAMTPGQRAEVLRAYTGERGNRRHKPGRAFERTSYRFDILTDYGAFRDLQRHRLLTLDWQSLTTRHGYIQPEAVVDAGGSDDWNAVMDRSAALYDALVEGGLRDAAQYVVSMAYRVRFVMDMNAREAMHTIELRSGREGHPSYRAVAHEMHAQIAAAHPAVAAAMTHVDTSTEPRLERILSEMRTERRALGTAG
jgi:thymidylate synthase ThyX